MMDGIKKIVSNLFSRGDQSEEDDSQLSSHEQRLQSFFDGELDPKDAEDFVQSHAGKDAEVERELERMSELRSSLSDMIKGLYCETRHGSGRVTIWQQIEEQVRNEALARRDEIEFAQNKFGVAKFADWIEPFLAPRVVFGGVLGIAFAFFLGVRVGTVEKSAPAKMQLSSTSVISAPVSSQISRSTQLTPRRQLTTVDVRESRRAVSNPNFSVVGFSSSSQRNPGIRLKVSRELARRRTLEHRMPLHIDTDQLIGLPRSKDRKVNIPGGLRAEGADIDWIESDREFELLPVKNKRSIPVIWVSGEARK